MSAAQITVVKKASAAAVAGLRAGDTLLSVNGEQLRDVIQFQLLTDGPDPIVELERGDQRRTLTVSKGDGEPLGIEVESSIFDQVRTCDNHCSFCFIYQLPKGMRRSLYLKDDDYRLSFLYGNFTTLTRFTEADLERVIDERLSPLYVSIHATNREVRASMLRNRRGATSLRWLRALLDHGIEVHGQVVVCPGVNDGEVLEETLTDVADWYRELKTLAVVPLGISRYSAEAEMRPHTTSEAAAVIDAVEGWQGLYNEAFGRRLVYAADEYYLLAGRSLPPADTYGEFEMHEDGIGMIRCFEEEFYGRRQEATGPRSGFFSWVDGAPAEGYRAPRLGSRDPSCATPSTSGEQPVTLGSTRHKPNGTERIGVLTGTYGARCLAPLIATLDNPNIELLVVENNFFGGNIGVTGLMTGADIRDIIEQHSNIDRYLLPDVCLSEGRFLDGLLLGEVGNKVEVVPTDGHSLRKALAR